MRHAVYSLVQIRTGKYPQGDRALEALQVSTGSEVINRYLLIGRHTSVAIFDAPDEEALIKIVGPFSGFGVAHVSPIMKLEDALKVTW